jgi:ketosteroid isomerase-like protein
MSFDETVQALFEGIKSRDVEKLLSTISIDEEVSLILPNGAYFNGRSAFINLHTAWFADPDWQMNVKVLRTIETPEMGYAMILADYSDITLADQPYEKQHYLSLVFIKKEGEWLLVHDQNTVAQ